VRAAWWQEWQDEVMNGFLVEPQNQDRVGTSWEPIHEWWLAEATPSSRGFQWFTRKPLGSLVDPQSQGRRPKVAAPDRSDRCATSSLETSKRRARFGIARCVSRLLQVRSPGIHPMARWRSFPKAPSGACILV
jgi:hypothetical protein